MIPGLGRSPGGGHGNPLQDSCLENLHGQRSLASYSPWGRKESDVTERLSTACRVFPSHYGQMCGLHASLWQFGTGIRFFYFTGLKKKSQPYENRMSRKESVFFFFSLTC